MAGNQRSRAKEIFLGICDLEPDERELALAAACGDDHGLRREVEELLAFDDPRAAFAEAIDRPACPVIEGFDVLQKVGEGGMGEVWEAEQLSPVRRRVAIKLVRWGLSSSEVIARFESERQALALMQHANIAQVFGAGSTEDGRPFFSMEFVKGVPITDYCDAVRMSTEDRLRLFGRVCDAVRHAHQKGIIHRDLKPSNVLVEARDQPTPKIIDFGVAKAMAQPLTGRSSFTRLGQLIGTPEYMSPEQAELTGLDVDTRSDVYSLGVLLYELLVGAPPLDKDLLRGATFDEMRRMIREHEPLRPSSQVTRMGEASQIAASRRRTDAGRLARLMRGDLDWIVMKALEKDRTRRYGSVAELADDIDRHLGFRPVLAGPPSVSYRLGKLLRRNRLAAVAAGLSAILLAAGVAGTSWGLFRARREAEVSRRTLDFVLGVFQELNIRSTASSVTSIELALDSGVSRLDREFDGRPIAKAELLGALADAYAGLGFFEKATPLVERAIGIWRVERGGSSDELVDSLSQLGRIRTDGADFEAAGHALAEAHGILEARGALDGARAGQVAGHLARLASKRGETEQARALAEEAVRVLEGAVGPDDPSVADVLFTLRAVLLEMGELGRAISVARRTCSIRISQLGPDHYLVGWALNDLGTIYLHLHQHSAARTLLDRARTIFTEKGGEAHFAVSYPLYELGLLDWELGRTDSAIAAFERALAIREGALGRSHPELVEILRSYGMLLANLGDVETGRQLLTRAVAIAEEAWGPMHNELAYTLTVLSGIVHQAGDLRLARELNERALTIHETSAWPGSRFPGLNHYNLACIAAEEGDRTSALSHLQNAVEWRWSHRTVFSEPAFDRFRDDPEFEQVFRELSRLRRASEERMRRAQEFAGDGLVPLPEATSQ